MDEMQRELRPMLQTDATRCQQGDVAATGRQLRLARLRLLESDQALQTLLASHSWQVTAPARHVGARFPALARALLRLWKLCAWVALGQVGVRLRSRRLGRQRRREAVDDEVPAAPVPRLAPEALAPAAPVAGGQTILIVDASIPRPDRHAGARTTAAFVRAFLDAGWSVMFAPFDGLDDGDYTRALAAQGVLVVDGRVIGGIAAWLAAHGPALDQVMLMRPRPARALLAPVLEHTAARISYYGHDLHFARLRREAELAGDIDLGEIAERELAIERQIWRTVDVVLYPSSAETAVVAALVPGTEVAAVPALAFTDFPPVRQPPGTADLLFVGNFRHPPNEDAAIWFAGAVLARIRAARPDARLVIAGAHPTERVLALSGDGIEVTGSLSDDALQRCYQSARVVVVPLRFGAGVKGKVVEALRNGVPLVTTQVGAEGLPGLEAIVPVQDEPAMMAEAILRLLAEDVAWTDQAAAGIAYARAHFSRDALRRALLEALAPRALAAGTDHAPAGGNATRKGTSCRG